MLFLSPKGICESRTREEILDKMRTSPVNVVRIEESTKTVELETKPNVAHAMFTAVEAQLLEITGDESVWERQESVQTVVSVRVPGHSEGPGVNREKSAIWKSPKHNRSIQYLHLIGDDDRIGYIRVRNNSIDWGCLL